MRETVAVTAGIHVQIPRHRTACHILARFPELAVRYIKPFHAVRVVKGQADLHQFVLDENAGDVLVDNGLYQFRFTGIDRKRIEVIRSRLYLAYHFAGRFVL